MMITPHMCTDKLRFVTTLLQDLFKLILAKVSHKQSSILPEAKKNYNKDTDEGYCSRKVSVESSASTISSDSGLASSPDSAPEDERVVIGEEKNPKIQTSSDLPDDVKERFRGQSREVRIINTTKNE